jgi:hypothetical protein
MADRVRHCPCLHPGTDHDRRAAGVRCSPAVRCRQPLWRDYRRRHVWHWHGPGPWLRQPVAGAVSHGQPARADHGPRVDTGGAVGAQRCSCPGARGDFRPLADLRVCARSYARFESFTQRGHIRRDPCAYRVVGAGLFKGRSAAGGIRRRGRRACRHAGLGLDLRNFSDLVRDRAGVYRDLHGACH